MRQAFRILIATITMTHFRGAVKSLSRVFRSELLRWFGVLGLALTIIGKLDPVLALAKFIHKIAEKWIEITHAFWGAIFSCFSLSLSKETAIALNIFVLISLLTTRSRLQEIKVHWAINMLLGIINTIAIFSLVFLMLGLQLDITEPLHYKFIFPEEGSPEEVAVRNAPSFFEALKSLKSYWLDNWDPVLGWTLILFSTGPTFFGSHAALSLNILRLLGLLGILYCLNFAAIHADEIKGFFQ